MPDGSTCVVTEVDNGGATTTVPADTSGVSTTGPRRRRHASARPRRSPSPTTSSTPIKLIVTKTVTGTGHRSVRVPRRVHSRRAGAPAACRRRRLHPQWRREQEHQEHPERLDLHGHRDRLAGCGAQATARPAARPTTASSSSRHGTRRRRWCHQHVRPTAEWSTPRPGGRTDRRPAENRRLAPDKPASVLEEAEYSASLSRRWRASTRRTVPDCERITSDWVVAPRLS